MKKLLIAAVVAGSMLSASVLAGDKIGIINVKSIISQSSQLQAASKSMQKNWPYAG